MLCFHVAQDVTRGIDTSLTLKLQKRLTELEQEKQSLRNELENKEEQFQRARARVLQLHTDTPGHSRICQALMGISWVQLSLRLGQRSEILCKNDTISK